MLGGGTFFRRIELDFRATFFGLEDGFVGERSGLAPLFVCDSREDVVDDVRSEGGGREEDADEELR